MDTTHAEDVKKHVRIYVAVFAALAVLTIVTVTVGYLHLPIVPALIVALVIATIKGSLVAAYFMHLVSEKRVIFSVLAITGIFLFFMFLILTSSFYDQGGSYVP